MDWVSVTFRNKAGDTGDASFERTAVGMRLAALEIHEIKDYTPMMRREDLEEYARRRPFRPFEVRLIDGERFRMTSIERFVVGRNTLAVLDRRGVIVQVSLGLIATIRPIEPRKARRGRAS